MFHNGQLLIRLILLLWNSCSTTGVQDLANHQLWNHVNSLNRKIKKIQHFGKYFLLRSPMHIKSIYTSQDFILQLDMIIILPPEVIWSKSHHPNPCYWQKTSILFHNWSRSTVGVFTLHCPSSSKSTRLRTADLVCVAKQENKRNLVSVVSTTQTIHASFQLPVTFSL